MASVAAGSKVKVACLEDMAVTASFTEMFSKQWWMEVGFDHRIYLMKSGARLRSIENAVEIGHVLNVRKHVSKTGKAFIVVNMIQTTV